MRPLRLFGVLSDNSNVTFVIQRGGLVRHIWLEFQVRQNGMTSFTGWVYLKRTAAVNQGQNVAQLTNILAQVGVAARADSASGVLRLDGQSFQNFIDVTIQDGESLFMELDAETGVASQAMATAILWFDEPPLLEVA